MGIKTLVVALDLMDPANFVLARSIALARDHSAELIVVHVVESKGALEATLPPAATARLRNEVASQAHIAIEERLESAGRPPACTIVVRDGAPYEIIREIAIDRKADLVVIGAGKAKGLREKVFGSTADRVVRTCPSPVLVVRQPVHGPYQQIFVATDLQCHGAVDVAAELAPAATIELIHVVEFPLNFEQALLRSGAGPEGIKTYRDERRRFARSELRSVVKQRKDSARFRVRVVPGDPGRLLVRLSRIKRTQLIALGANRRSGLSQALIGSVAMRVLREAACDLLLARETRDDIET